MAARTYGLVIDGETVEPDSRYEIINPATEQVVAEAPEASVAQANAAVDAAADALPAWSATSPEERAALLDRAADLIDAAADELVPLVQAETGATYRVTKTIQVPQSSTYMRPALSMPPRVPGSVPAMKYSSVRRWVHGPGTPPV